MQYTGIMELEGGSLPFLDARVTMLTNRKLDITVYRKKDAHGQVPTFWVSPPDALKGGTVRCLYDRARNITQWDESLKEEEEESHLMKTFIVEWLSSSLRMLGRCTVNTERACRRWWWRRHRESSDRRSSKCSRCEWEDKEGVSGLQHQNGVLTLRNLLTKAKDPRRTAIVYFRFLTRRLSFFYGYRSISWSTFTVSEGSAVAFAWQLVALLLDVNLDRDIALCSSCDCVSLLLRIN